MKRESILLFIISLALLLPGFVSGQTPAAKPAAAKTQAKSEFGNTEDITAAQLRDYLFFVASDEMEGRDTPSRGLDLTAKFIGLNLSRWGYKPVGDDGTFFQKIPLQSRRVDADRTSGEFNGQPLKVGTDFIARPVDGKAAGQLVFVGYGLMVKSKGIDPYQGIDVRDKIMVVIEGMPRGLGFSDFRGREGVDFIRPETWAKQNGARGIVLIPGSMTISSWGQRHQQSLAASRPTMPNGRLSTIPTIVASENLATRLLEGEQIDYETLKKQVADGNIGPSFALSAPKKVDFSVGVTVDTVMTQNVVAVFEGTDPVLKQEYVAIGAHYDHVGVGQPDKNGDRIFNGADDDGSGTVAVLAIAEALARGPRPKRSVLFVWHTGEEKGLWGSEWITDHPVVPLDKIITQLNVDMIGRSRGAGDTDPRNANLTGPAEIYVIGSKMMSSELGALSEKVNDSFQKLTFNYKYDDPNDTERFFFRSDHYNYARKGIPIIFYFDGVHADYHRQSDSPDKIDYQKMERVTRAIFAQLWKLTGLPARPKVDRQLPSQLAGQ